jgi:host factor-I protein
MTQDQFLIAITQDRVPVTVYLANGIRLQGRIDAYDRHGMILSGAGQQFIFKHAISTIVPGRDMGALKPS